MQKELNKIDDISGGYINHDFVAEYYDNILPFSDDLEFYTDLAEKAGGRVLELASGTGRTLIPLAKKGIDITGLEISGNMVEKFNAKLNKEPEELKKHINVIVGDMRNFDLGKKFPLITIPYCSFTYLTEVEDQLACLNSVLKHLAPGGTFYMSVFNETISALADVNVFEEFDITPEFQMPDGRKVLRRFRYIDRDYTRQVEVKESIFYITYPDGREERLVHRFSMRYFFSFELIHLLERVGFKVTELYSDYSGTPHNASIYEGQIIVMAEKQK